MVSGSTCKELESCHSMQPTPVFLPGESYGQKSLAGYKPWGCKGSDMTEQLSTGKVEKTEKFNISSRLH